MAGALYFGSIPFSPQVIDDVNSAAATPGSTDKIPMLTAAGLVAYTTGPLLKAAVPINRIVVPTTVGDTTGQLLGTDEFVTVNSTNSAFKVTLPSATAAMVGKSIRGLGNATAYNLVTFAASTDLLNNVDSSGGTVKAIIPASVEFWARCVAVNKWVFMTWTALGAVATAIVPA